MAARTDGPADMVFDANKPWLDPNAPDGLSRAVRRTIAPYDRPEVWRTRRRAGMMADFAWAESARRYALLYRTLAGGTP